MEEQVAANTASLIAIQNYGAGLVALVIIFGGIVFLLRYILKEFIPALKSVGKSITDAVASLGLIVESLNKTIEIFQSNSVAESRKVEGLILNLTNKLDYHCDVGKEIKDMVSSNSIVLAEIKGNTRNCAANLRPPGTHTRKGEQTP